MAGKASSLEQPPHFQTAVSLSHSGNAEKSHSTTQQPLHTQNHATDCVPSAHMFTSDTLIAKRLKDGEQKNRSHQLSPNKNTYSENVLLQSGRACFPTCKRGAVLRCAFSTIQLFASSRHNLTLKIAPPLNKRGILLRQMSRILQTGLQTKHIFCIILYLMFWNTWP